MVCVLLRIIYQKPFRLVKRTSRYSYSLLRVTVHGPILLFTIGKLLYGLLSVHFFFYYLKTVSNILVSKSCDPGVDRPINDYHSKSITVS